MFISFMTALGLFILACTQIAENFGNGLFFYLVAAVLFMSAIEIASKEEKLTLLHLELSNLKNASKELLTALDWTENESSSETFSNSTFSNEPESFGYIAELPTALRYSAIFLKLKKQKEKAND